MTEEYGLQNCTVEISTTVDGVETQIKRKGKLGLFPRSVELSYTDENANVQLRLQGETATIERTGDYTLRLCLENGQTRSGWLGIGGAEGELQVFTRKIAYLIGKNSLLASLQYTLRIGDEPQEMKLRISARVDESK